MELCQILCQFLHVCGRLGVTPWLEEEIVQPYYSVITRGVARNRQVYFRIIIIIIHLLKLAGGTTPCLCGNVVYACVKKD